MSYNKVDKSSDFINSGMTLITEVESERYLKKNQTIQEKENLYEVPDDRFSRPCGGSFGFDDFVERWME
jgi:hypothetical protein